MVIAIDNLYLAAAPRPEVSTLILEILEEWYFDGIETLVSAEIKGNKIVGEFTDRVGPRQVKRFKYEVSEQSVEYWLLNGKEAQGFSLQMFRRPLFGKGSRAGQKKKCVKGVPCGDSCQTAAPNKDGSPRRCLKEPGSATQAKIKQAKQELGGGAPRSPKESLATKANFYTSTGFIKFDPDDEDDDAMLETFVGKDGAEIQLFTQEAGMKYTSISFGLSNWASEVKNSYTAYATIAAYSLDVNKAIALPGTNKLSIRAENLQEEVQKRMQILESTLTDGDMVFMDGTRESDRDVAEAMGLKSAKYIYLPTHKFLGPADDKEPYLNPAKGMVGRYENGKIRPVTDEEVQRVAEIRQKRKEQFDLAVDSQVVNALFDGDRLIPDPDNPGDEVFESVVEDRIASRIATLEDAHLGRKPTKIGDFASYEAKADKWARSQFGDFSEGANGFSLAQTKAHDVAHPITHELTGLDSAKISARFGGLKQVDGKPSLLAEEAVVNIVEHLSRGDSIEASIMNGLRLGRVLSRSPNETDDARKYVRSREFKNELVRTAHQLYRHNNFSLYMAHVRKSNRISGTVRQAGDDFQGSASGG